MTPPASPRLALTIDVEDWFQVGAFKDCIAREAWEGMASRTEANTRKVLDLLDDFSLRGTFFVLGWEAARRPGLVREIAARGHEVACHGHGHELIYDIGPMAFRQDVLRAKGLLEDLLGAPVLGYRAPSWSITARSLWALDVLVEAGFAYDSSIFPIHHDLCGIPGAEPRPCRLVLAAGSLAEFPPTTLPLSLGGRRLHLPVAGGGYLRQLPGPLFRWLYRRATAGSGLLYFHPWELDPGQPRLRAPFRSRFRHYRNLDKTEPRLRRLLPRHAFAPMATVLASLGDLPARRIVLDAAGRPRMEPVT